MTRANLLTVLVVSAGCAAFWMFTPTHAQRPAGADRGSIAIVDVPRVFRSCKETVAMNRDMEEKTRQIQAGMEAQTQRLKKLEEAMKNFDPNGKDFKDKANELLTERIRMRVAIEEQQRQIVMEQQLRAEKFYAKITEHIQAIALEHGYDVVLFHEDLNFREAKSPDQLLEIIRERKVLYNSPRSDITKLVVDRLDAEYASPPARN